MLINTFYLALPLGGQRGLGSKLELTLDAVQTVGLAVTVILWIGIMVLLLHELFTFPDKQIVLQTAILIYQLFSIAVVSFSVTVITTVGKIALGVE